jgi:hypothetical protein
MAGGERLRSLGPGHSEDREAVYPGEIRGIASVQRKLVRDRSRRDHRVVRSGCALTTGSAERRRDAAERAGGRRVEGKRVEVGLGLLEMSLARGALLFVPRHEGPDGQLCEGDRGDEWFSGKRGGVCEAAQGATWMGRGRPEPLAARRSHSRVEHLVDVCAQSDEVYPRQSAPPR